MDHYGDGCEHHAKQEDRETFDCLTEFKKLVKAKLALPPLEEMRMVFLKKIYHPWRNFNLERPGEKIYSSCIPKVISLAKAGKLKELKKLISKDGVESALVKTKDGQTILHFAACGGHTRICDFLLSDHRFDVNTKDSMGRTPLHEAALGNYFDTFKGLIRYGADCKAQTSMGLTALHFAVEGGNCSAIRYLVSHGIDVNAKSDFGTPLWMAAIQSQHEAMKVLLSLNADTKISPDGMLSPLHASILNCSFECVDALLSARADPYIKSCGVSPLEAAIKCGDKMIVQKLSSEGAIQDGIEITREKAEEVYSLYKSVGQKAYDAGKYHTSFVWYTKEAAARLEEIQNYNESKLNLPSIEEIRMLLHAKVAVLRSSNLNPKIPDRSTVQKFVDLARCGDIGELRLLISKLGPKRLNLLLDIRTRMDETILHVAAAAGHTDICEYILLELKFDIDIQDSQCCTPFHMAIRANKIETISWFIDHGADVNAMTLCGQTALHVAAKAGSLEVMRLLISKGSDVNAVTDFGTPLSRSAIHNQKEAMLLLLSNGAKPNEFLEGTRSPLCEAIMNQSYECVKHLIEAKANPNIKSLGASPLETAILDGNIRILKLLLEEGANANERDVYDLLPLELAVLEEDEEMAKILFPKTLRIPDIKDWSVDGLRKHYENEEVNKQMILKAENAYSLYNSKGQEAYKAGKFVAAINWYAEAIHTDKCDQASVLFKLSLCSLQLNEYDDARNNALASKYAEGESLSAEANYTYSLAFLLLKDFKTAADCIEQVACEKLQSDLGVDDCYLWTAHQGKA